jgi:ABC-type bacteriocin/lantibiotic exporter with double-glycine peptidase domain
VIPQKAPQKRSSERFRELWPDIREMARPRWKVLAVGFVLMLISKVCGLVLPTSSKYLIDNVIGKHQMALLGPLVLAVLAATIVQGVTGFAITQLVSKAGQRLIAELRAKVQAHIGRLPVAYYDANKTGTLVARIMTDVDGIRNLLGTGLIEFFGGILTAVLVLGFLLRLSTLLTTIALVIIIAFALTLRKAFGTIRPIFRERGKINAEVTGRLTESLGGVRVIKGYHAEAREEAVFESGVQRLLNNILKSLTATSFMSLSATVLMGAVGAVIMYVGARQINAKVMTLGDFVTFTALLAFLIAPMFQLVNIGTQLTEALAGLERTREVLRERPEDQDPRRTVSLPPITGEVIFDRVNFAYDTGKEVLHEISFRSDPGTVTALVGSSGSGKSTIIGLIAAFHGPQSGTVLVDGVDLSPVHPARRRAPGDVPV